MDNQINAKDLGDDVRFIFGPDVVLHLPQTDLEGQAFLARAVGRKHSITFMTNRRKMAKVILKRYARLHRKARATFSTLVNARQEHPRHLVEFSAVDGGKRIFTTDLAQMTEWVLRGYGEPRMRVYRMIQDLEL